MDSAIYFQSLELTNDQFPKNTIGNITDFHSVEGFPDVQQAQIAIIGVCEGRNALNNEGCADAPNKVRNYLYKLFDHSNGLKIVDLGNIFPGNEVSDTYFALSSTIAELLKLKIVPIILGGSQDLTFANYKAYEMVEQIINIVSIDSEFDLGEQGEVLNSRSYLTKILLNQPNYLFNFSNIGYQTYLVNNDALELMTKLFFDVYRLGEMRTNMEEIEPIVRNADMMSFDISSIKQTDAPANGNALPNGFYSEEACQIARYAGMSDKLTSFGLYEINPTLDICDQTIKLAAQIIWHFLDGFNYRKKDMPIFSKKDFVKYSVAIDDNDFNELVFYKSRKSDRWWMDIPYPPNKGSKYDRHHLVPCSYADYETACKKEVPDRWWRTYQKLN